MSVWAVAMVKDEADVIEATVGRMLLQVDRVLVADNMSSDGTADLLAGMAAREKRLTVIHDDVVGYYQSEKMSGLAAMAADEGAEWVVPFDADEVWRAQWGTVAEVLRALPAIEGIAPAVLFDHVTTDGDPAIKDPTRRIQWRRPVQLPLHKVAVRPVARVVIEQGNHGAHYFVACPNPVLEVRHFPYRSGDQFVRKVRNGAAAYAATDLPEHAGAHWRQYGAILDASGPQVLVDEVYRRWFHEADPAAAGLILDPV